MTSTDRTAPRPAGTRSSKQASPTRTFGQHDDGDFSDEKSPPEPGLYQRSTAIDLEEDNFPQAPGEADPPELPANRVTASSASSEESAPSGPVQLTEAQAESPLAADAAFGDGGPVDVRVSKSPQLSGASREGSTVDRDHENDATDHLDPLPCSATEDAPSPNLREELGPWSAPPEPLRPVNPYTRGAMFEIRRHKASPPFGDRYPNYPGVRDIAGERDLRTKTRVEICLEHPPMKGETAWDEPPRNLHIVDEIRVSDESGAQILVGRLDSEPDEYLVKIYDPLYYGFSDTMWRDDPRDVADEADKDYCREVAAYLELDDQFGGKEIPKFHGSWTLQTPLYLPDGQKMRDVRLILMERIQGRTMSDIDPSTYPPQVRLGALKQLLEMVSYITFAGVSHGDFAQRNIVICDGETPNTIGRIVLIDFNFAVVTRLDDFELQFGSLEEIYGPGRTRRYDKPNNPLEDWWGADGIYMTFGDWLPESWDQMRRPVEEWLREQWEDSDEFCPYKKPLEWTES